MRRRPAVSTAFLALVIVCMTIASSVAPAAGAGALEAPVVTLALFPFGPDGADGWYVTEPEVYATVSDSAELGWGWESVSSTLSVSAGVSTYVSDAPEGVRTFVYRAVSTGGVTGGAALIKTDVTPPATPAGFTATGFPGPGVLLQWEPSADSVSGVGSYVVYRDTDGPPYEYSDRLATTAGTLYTDAGDMSAWRNAAGHIVLAWDPLTGEMRYAVAAVDVAGNSSLLTEAQVTGGDFESLVVMRSVDGAEFSSVATLPLDAVSFVDTDAPTGSVLYALRGVDASGTVLSDSPITPVLDDFVAPPAPGPGLTPIYSPDGPARFRLAWSNWLPITDDGSGLLSAELLYGQQGEPPSTQPATGETLTLTASAPTALWTASVRSEDRAGNVSASPASVARNVGTQRIGGADRFATSRYLAESAFTSADTAIFASALDFPDALAASALAGAVRGPVVLVGRGPLPQSTVMTLKTLGVRNAYVVGGTPSVGAETYRSIDAALSGALRRIAGRDRYETAGAVARVVADLSGTPARAYVVSGRVFADALSAGPAAYADRSPVLFATDKAVPAATTRALRDLKVGSTVVLGGFPSVTRSAERVLPQPTRLAGADRYATSRAFAGWAMANEVLQPSSPVLVTGLRFPDGLSAAPLAGELRGAVVLDSETAAATTALWLQERRAELDLIRLIGSSASLSDALRLRTWTAVSRP